jgi:methylenetetrahydrofolate reductase (NADPH)
MAHAASISFELFPPRTARAEEELSAVTARLARLGPDYMTVTYGAGGTTADPTLRAVLAISESTGLPTASHITFVATPIWEVASYAQKLRDAGIDRVVALRGDAPKGRPADRYGGPGFFRSSPAFVASLKTAWGFDISVSAYPEKHPDAPLAEGDIDMLARKADAGASRALTQFFFDNDIYYRFLEEAEAADVGIPIYPGVLPILDFTKMQSFAARCGASVPRWLVDKFAPFDKPEDRRRISEEVLLAQVEDLLANGVAHIHVFTLNEAGFSELICRSLPLGGSKASAAQQ